MTKIRKRGVRQRVKTEIKGESKTRQSEAKNADINTIVNKAKKTGHLPVTNAQPIQNGLPTPQSFHDAMNVVVQAKQEFEALPSQVRNEFNNDPAFFLECVQKAEKDDKQKESLQKLGVLETPEVKVEPAPQKVEIVNPEITKTEEKN